MFSAHAHDVIYNALVPRLGHTYDVQYSISTLHVSTYDAVVLMF